MWIKTTRSSLAKFRGLAVAQSTPVNAVSRLHIKSRMAICR